MSNKTAAIIVASMIGVTLVGMGVWISTRSTPNGSPLVGEPQGPDKSVEVALPSTIGTPPRALTIPETKIPAFRIFTDKIAYDSPLRSQIEIDVFMEEQVTEESIHLLLDHLYALAEKAGPFQYRQHPNYVFISVYARKGQDKIAWGFKSPSDEFEVTIRDDLLAIVNDPPIARFGLTEGERQMIWRDIVRVEDRAHRDAEKMYPFPMPKNDPNYTETGEKNQLSKQSDYATELMKRYRKELADSLGLTMEQLKEIGNEGVKNWWETAPPR